MDESISTLWKNEHYNLKIPYIASVYITEYDLSKANINALYTKEIIDKDVYERLYNSPKSYREVVVGVMQRGHPEVYNAIKYGIQDARQLLFETNQLQDKDIFAIKKDAVFVIGNRKLISEFGNYVFKIKNVYKFAMNTTIGLQIFYNNDPITNIETIDIKGISDKNLEKHTDFMIQFLCKMFFGILNNPIEVVMNEFNIFYNSFINKKLLLGYYREFNSDSTFRVNFKNISYGMNNISENELPYIDINANLSLLRDINYVLSDIYVNQNKSI